MERSTLYKLVSTMKKADLSLYYPDGNQDAFWSSVRDSPQYRDEVAEIQAEGNLLRGVAIPELSYSLFSLYTRTGSRLEYEKVYFERRKMMNIYVLLALLEPEQEEHLICLQDILWSVCNEYTWCLPAHLGETDIPQTIDLFAAETGFALSEISLLLGNRLPALLQFRLKEEVYNRLFLPYLTCGPYHWETATHNWAAVCAGSIGAAALLMLRDPETLTDILLKVQGSLEYYLQGFGNDGACLEGLGYWNYGFGYFVYYSDLLRQLSKGELDWFRKEKAGRIAGFQQKCFLGGDVTANFSDSQPEGRVHLGLSHYLAAVFPEVEPPPLSLRAAFTEDHCNRWAPAFRNLIWKNPAACGQDWEAVSYYMSDAQWLVSRHVHEGETFGFAAKGGHNGEPHNHNDLGQFILARAGQVYVSDLGSGEYRSGYFGAERYSYDCNGSQGHCVPVIDGLYQSEGAEAHALVLEASTSGAEDVLILDLTLAYKHEDLQGLTRSFVWHKGERVSLTLSDEFNFRQAPGTLMERFVTFHTPLIEAGFAVVGGAGGTGLRIAYDDSLLRPDISRHSYSDHFGVEKTWYGLDFHVRNPGRQELLVFEFQFVMNNHL